MDLKNQLAGFAPGDCDKCHLPVPLGNNVIALMFVRSGTSVLGLDRYRHLLPVEAAGKIVCDGSPNRAQYLKGQPRDTRSNSYSAAQEAPTRVAYSRLQKIATELAA